MTDTFLPEVREHFSRRLEEYVNTPELDLPDIPGLKLGRVLEVGCGAKFSLNRAEEKYGVDITLGLLKELRRHDSDVNLIIADVRFLPFRDSSFDTVVAVFLLHHLVGETVNVSRRNILKGLGEMARVSNQRGHLLILELLAENWLFSYVLFYVTWLLAKLGLNLEYFDIHDRVVTYYLDNNLFERMIRQTGLACNVVACKLWQFRNFRLGHDSVTVAQK